MIRKSATYMCVRTLLSVFKLNWTCLVVMRHGLLSTTRTPNTRAVSRSFQRHVGQKWKSIKVKSHVDHLWFLACVRDDQSASLLRHILGAQETVHKKRRDLWQDKSRLLNHGNMPTHNAYTIWQFLDEKNIWNNLSIYLFLPCGSFFSPSAKIIKGTP